ncbi:forkhead box protein N4-like isoform X2 [Gigantopelta aegis]|uniref:forkhead box protein N4-like isoform X2 n=1 Tax=Gigantopelta aegis TaxID=1735272 RepID=UPI001B88A0A0|nr:forkhead box protein N4-like isoform X2 [Gigantopelta aegis]
MDNFYNHGDGDPMSIMDMITCDDRHEMDNLFVLHSDSDRHETDLKIENPGLPDFDNILPENTSDMDDLEWLQNAAMDQLNQAVHESENTDPNLLVNPRTVIPIHLQQTSSQQVRDAMLTDSCNNVTLTVNNVTTSQVQSAVQSLASLNSNNNDEMDTGYNITRVTLPGQSGSKNVMSPSLSSPVLVGHLQNGPQMNHKSFVTATSQSDQPQEKVFPKPVFSYSCLIALALKNSESGNLPVSEIYSFMIENFPYFKTAPDGWKNSVRHNLSLNKCFAKVDNPKLSASAKKGCLWGLNPAKVVKMEEEISKWGKKDLPALLKSMAFPENLEAIEKGEAGLRSREKKSQSKFTDTSVSNIPSQTLPVTPKKQVHRDSNQNTHYVTILNQSIKMEPASLDSSFSLDPSLADTAVQNGLWDEDLVSNFGMDSASSMSVNLSSPLLQSGSPVPYTMSSGTITS